MTAPVPSSTSRRMSACWSASTSDLLFCRSQLLVIRERHFAQQPLEIRRDLIADVLENRLKLAIGIVLLCCCESPEQEIHAFDCVTARCRALIDLLIEVMMLVDAHAGHVS